MDLSPSFLLQALLVSVQVLAAQKAAIESEGRLLEQQQLEHEERQASATPDMATAIPTAVFNLNAGKSSSPAGDEGDGEKTKGAGTTVRSDRSGDAIGQTITQGDDNGDGDRTEEEKRG